MKIKSRYLRQIIREALLLEEPNVDLTPDKNKTDKDLEVDSLDIPIPATLKKLLDPDISPAKYADLDQVIDQADNLNHQALAIASFALSYTDMSESDAVIVLNKAKALVPKIIKSQQKK